MANEKLLALLRQGSEVWNTWRRENFDPNSEIDLSEADLVGANLSQSNLSGATLSGAKLSEANLSSANLHSVNLIGANLSRTNLNEAYLNEAKLHKADLSSADLSEANLSKANLNGTNLIGAEFYKADLSEADCSGADFTSASLFEAKLSGAKLSRANLSYTDLTYANFSGAKLSNTKLIGANLSFAKLNAANLSEADLSEANLVGAKLNRANLSRAGLGYANLNGAKLSRAILNGASLDEASLSNTDFRSAELCNTNLHASQVRGANFTQATLTGACIADWQISSSTILEGVECDYIFRTYDDKKLKFTGRLPVDPQSTFAPGEFEQWIQIREDALETIDITFTDGIDWQAFFQSFQELRRQRPDQDISIQGMERKGKAFVVRLEVEADVDKAAIETQIKQFYADQLAALEAQYEKQLKLQGVHLEDARRTIEKERQEKATLMGIMATMAENQGSKYDMRGAQFAGGFAETVNGKQIGGIINNYGQNTDDILRLLTSLRDLSQSFPDDQKEKAQMALDGLEADLNKPEKPSPKRLGQWLKMLILAGTAAATFVEGAATFSGNVNEFTDNTSKLIETLGLSREDIQPTP